MKAKPPIPEITYVTDLHLKALEALHDLAIKKDPALNRLRRCPETGVYHYVEHLSKDFLNEKSAEKYYNEHKRALNHAEDVTEQLLNKGNQIATNVVVSAPPITPVNPYEGIQVIDEVTKKKTQAFLKDLLGTKSTMVLNFSSFDSPDFNLKSFDEINPITNSDLTFASYGEYVICWRKEDTFLLTTKKQMLWTFQ
jgi:hypothetical protein